MTAFLTKACWFSHSYFLIPLLKAFGVSNLYGPGGT